MRPIHMIVVHCSATPPASNIGKAEIDRWHRAKGWLGIGYHFVIRRDGTVETGRRLELVGAHAAPYNTGSIGICMVGGVDEHNRAEDNFTPPQWDALERLTKDLLIMFRISRVVGHRDLSPDKDGDGVISPWEYMKECPCFDVSTWLHVAHLTHLLSDPE